MGKERYRRLSLLGLSFGAALLGWISAAGMFAVYVVVALLYSASRFNDNCTRLQTPTLMYGLALVMLTAILGISLAATYSGAKLWRVVDLRPALLLTALFLAPLLVASPVAIREANDWAIIWSDCGD